MSRPCGLRVNREGLATRRTVCFMLHCLQKGKFLPQGRTADSQGGRAEHLRDKNLSYYPAFER